MSDYLLTWNPDQFSTGGDGSTAGLLDYREGDEIRWSCRSKQPQFGDTVYLIRLGKEPRGIIAKGVVTQAPFSDSDWKDANLERSYIKFQLQELRQSCQAGLLPMLLLKASLPGQTWSSQTSGIAIKPDVTAALANLWNAGKNNHSLVQFMRWTKEHDFNQRWYEDYQATCQLAEEIRRGKPVTDSDINKLWRDKSNGIASAGQGLMYNKEFNSNVEFLRQLTVEIIKSPTLETYRQVFQRWKSDGTFERYLKVVINRVFGAASPQNYTSIADGSCLKPLYQGLQSQFQIDIKPNDDWLEDNQTLLAAVNPIIPSEWDLYTRNILLWNLYEWLVEPVKDDGHDQSHQADNQINEEDAEYMTSADPVHTQPKNVIYYGPPGTGKTYRLQQLQAEYTHRPAVMDESLWLRDKLAPLNWMQVLVLSLLSLGKRAKVAEIMSSKFFQTKASINGRTDNLAQTAWSYLQKFTIAESATVNYKGRSEPGVFDKSSDAVWQLLDDRLELVDDLVQLHAELTHGPQSADEIKRYATTTFHQSYGYEEFIEGLRAATDDEGNINYSVEPGEFLKLCRRAEQDPSHQYAMFIDEINRGNISKIFGELISLVEIDKRAGSQHPMTIQLAYSGKPFSVPSNVDIIGTMNTADRSLALMDTALRRRFDFIEMMPDSTLFVGHDVIDIGSGNTLNLGKLLDRLNQRIEVLYDREHTLGHAFFYPAYQAVKNGDHAGALLALKEAFQTKVIPLLQEYFYEDWQKIRLVLGDNQKRDASGKEVAGLQFVQQQPIDFKMLFGNDYEPDQFGVNQHRYELADHKHSVWDEGMAYLAIYTPDVAQRYAPDHALQPSAAQVEDATS
ncbi:McrB family protein [Aeromonas caviae]|uniref:ATP-binding protein n=1 Tax=Aeromonas caviae TaxID=648 RepID=A0AAV4YIQ5_AERCA|nr:AAA family ATPase [Aeromonas caviae]GJA31070.1 ATP-binding protein [Aeromonas caviae]GJA35348.1 ATP-binding protein [Aeromonas caviae]GJA40005.1 ATP-binding protein [Aeromonas caviae]GJA75738.1 ATP-binding protein [Aeromonas caviae]GJA95422.1 ATP-binding protein [Aeromonas caviae]